MLNTLNYYSYETAIADKYDDYIEFYPYRLMNKKYFIIMRTHFLWITNIVESTVKSWSRLFLLYEKYCSFKLKIKHNLNWLHIEKLYRIPFFSSLTVKLIDIKHKSNSLHEKKWNLQRFFTRENVFQLSWYSRIF